MPRATNVAITAAGPAASDLPIHLTIDRNFLRKAGFLALLRHCRILMARRLLTLVARGPAHRNQATGDQTR